MRICCTNPLLDTRWDTFVSQHPRASAFHQRGWLEALQRTYGYEPLVLTTSADGRPLDNGIVLCRVASWMTGNRLVSVPFADHCQPLLDEDRDLTAFDDWLGRACEQEPLRYVELRPLTALPRSSLGLERCASYWFHQLDLSASLDQIFARLHKNSFQRNIRRAERERLTYESGRSRWLVDEFYRLLVTTRRRHHLLPQPRTWFRNLVDCMGDKIQIRLARKDGRAIAAMLSLRHATSVVFKYGCSDARFHRFGAVPFLFWKLIAESKAEGARTIDLGRSDRDQAGLMAFKDRLGATRTLLNYYRHTNIHAKNAAAAYAALGTWDTMLALPDMVLSAAGRVLYRHLG
ncbi:MAG TPA: GNAT family N-acetyltransferase [Candidatus Aquilonibacter sp.]|nr:GNAT family N-acetyltransferase [Candidatus Aquilonibacter sp.]